MNRFLYRFKDILPAAPSRLRLFLCSPALRTAGCISGLPAIGFVEILVSALVAVIIRIVFPPVRPGRLPTSRPVLILLPILPVEVFVPLIPAAVSSLL